MYKRSIMQLLPALMLLLSCFTTGIACAATTLDESFAPVLSTPGTVTKITPLPDCRVVIIGGFTSISGAPRPIPAQQQAGVIALKMVALQAALT
ncbi:MAG: hypothetical protein WCG31_11630 [Deltaproteobacteria bacterium]